MTRAILRVCVSLLGGEIRRTLNLEGFMEAEQSQLGLKVAAAGSWRTSAAVRSNQTDGPQISLEERKNLQTQQRGIFGLSTAPLRLYLNLLGKVKKTSRKVIQYSFNLICLFFFQQHQREDEAEKQSEDKMTRQQSVDRGNDGMETSQTSIESNQSWVCVCVLKRWLGSEFRGSSARPCSAAAAATKAAAVTLNWVNSLEMRGERIPRRRRDTGRMTNDRAAKHHSHPPTLLLIKH